MRSTLATVGLFVFAVVLAIAAGVFAGQEREQLAGGETAGDTVATSGRLDPTGLPPDPLPDLAPETPLEAGAGIPPDSSFTSEEHRHGPLPGRPVPADAGARVTADSAGAPVSADSAGARCAALPEVRSAVAIASEAGEDGERSPWMRIPVLGVQPGELGDTFHETRGERIHEALDIHAGRCTPVVAAEAGEVQKIWESVPGGHTVYVIGQSGRLRYSYAHLEGYRPGLEQGDRLDAGEVLGYVGDSGNAVPGDNHLHFGVSLIGERDDWSGGMPVDPLPYLLRRIALPR